MALVALLATIAALVGILVTIAGPLAMPNRPAVGGGGAANGVARRFYDAVNATLAGDGSAALGPVVAPGLVVHRAGGDEVEPGGLDARLAALRQAAPDLRYAVGDIVADGDRVAVRLEVTGGPGASWSTAAPPGGGAGWGGTEVLRLAGDRVVEYWPAPVELAVAERAPDLTLPRQSGRLEVAAVRFDLRPGSAMPDLVGPVDHLVVPERGALAVDLARGGLVWRGGAPARGWQPTAMNGQHLALVPGDALLVPHDVRHTIRNPGGRWATMNGVGVFQLARTNAGEHQWPPSAAPLLFAYGLARLGEAQPRSGWDGVQATLLAGAFDACQAATELRLGLAWEPLLPGATIPAHSTSGPELTVPVRGRIGYAGDPPTVVSGAISAPGLAFATARGSVPALAQEGPLAARALVVRVEPVLATGAGGSPSSLVRPAKVAAAGCGGTA